MLRPISYRKPIALILDYDNDATFGICDCSLKLLEKDINAKIDLSTRCDNLRNLEHTYDCAVIRFNEPRTKQPILALDLTELLIRSTFRYDGRVTDRVFLTDIEVKHHNRQFDQIYLKLLEIGFFI